MLVGRIAGRIDRPRAEHVRTRWQPRKHAFAACTVRHPVVVVTIEPRVVAVGLRVVEREQAQLYAQLPVGGADLQGSARVERDPVALPPHLHPVDVQG